VRRLVDALAERGIRLRLQGDRVEFVGPKGAMTPELLRELREHRDDVRDYLIFESRRSAGDASATHGGELLLEPDRIIATAIESEGGGDLGAEEGDLREALGVYCESVERDARPHGLGRIYLSERMLRLSVLARLRLARAARAGEAKAPRRAPLVVCGLPRSGTTLLHRLLALADDAAGLPLWQLLEPFPPASGRDHRRDHAIRNITWLNALVSTSLDAQHYVRPDLPDECGHLLRTSFRGGMPWQAPATGWLAWSLRTSAAPAYRVWAACLAALEPEGSRLVLKDPFHMHHLDDLLAACPGAQIVQTHRDPLEVVPSFHKLCATMHAVLVEDPDARRNAAAETAWLEHMVLRNEETRAKVPPRQLVDVDYRALLADPIGTATRVHEAFGLPLTEGHVARMSAYLADNGQRKHGDNPYTAEAFGETLGALAERFAAYRARFGLSPP
jgi:hypothetical protein